MSVCGAVSGMGSPCYARSMGECSRSLVPLYAKGALLLLVYLGVVLASGLAVKWVAEQLEEWADLYPSTTLKLLAALGMSVTVLCFYGLLAWVWRLLRRYYAELKWSQSHE